MEKKLIKNINYYIPPDQNILDETIKLLKNGNTKIESITVCILQDPALTIKILSDYNLQQNVNESSTSANLSIKKAITQLGISKTLSMMEGLKNNNDIFDDEIENYLNYYRNKAKRAAIVAKILAEMLNPNLEDICYISSLFLYAGYLIAITQFKEKFLNIARDTNSEAKIRYQLLKQFNFDIYSTNISYVKKYKISDQVLTILDNSYAKTNDILVMAQEIVWASYEIIEAYDADKWSAYAPSKEIPQTSILRLFSITHDKYVKFYEKVSGFFLSFKIFNSKNSFNESDQDFAPLNKNSSKKITDVKLKSGSDIKDTKARKEEIEKLKKEKIIKKRNEYFALSNLNATQNTAPKTKKVKVTIKKPDKSNSAKTNKIVNCVLDALNNVKSCQKAITNILELLVKENCFEKAAIIVTSKDKKKAIVICARGEIANGQEIEITDEFSPLIGEYSKMQSFGNKDSEDSPFGSKSFAMAPLNLEHETPVILYADCGKNDSLPFNSRRVFRDTLFILNQVLPTLPDGLPVEI